MRWIILMTLLAAATARGEDYQIPRTVFVGDSITVRISAAPGWSWRELFLAAGGQYVLGVAPVTVPGAVVFLSGPATNRPQVGTVVILLGTGDYTRQHPIPGFTRNYDQLVSGLRPLGRVVCVLPLPRRDEGTLQIPLERYRRAILEVCPDAIDPREVIPEWTPALFEDGVHPSPDGATLVADWLRERLRAP